MQRSEIQAAREPLGFGEKELRPRFIPVTAKDDAITGNKGMGGQDVLAVPNEYNGWVQRLPSGEGANSYCGQLTAAQRSPFAGTVIAPCTP